MTLTRESKVRITSTAPPWPMTAIGWCEDCGDVEVMPEMHLIGEDYGYIEFADCPTCGGDVDQWGWT